ncbi:hypothetical protein WDU94_009214 [Cyamophila willieti]
MMEYNQDFVYDDSNTLKQNMAVLFNNPQHSDIMFIIGDSKLYAWSGLLSVASPKLGDMINLHFENCHDREMTLHGIKNVESFSLVLRYIYGLSINFSQTSLTVLCEALKLSKNYEMTNFSKDLMDYVSKIDCFSLESAVALLNIANKYNIQELNKKVTIFSYHNADELMKHPSFQDLHYDVLLKMLESDWFCSSEIDILKGVLQWHSDLDNERENLKKTLDKDNVGGIIASICTDQDETTAVADQPDYGKKDLSKEMNLETNNDDEHYHEISKMMEKIFEKINQDEKDNSSSGSSEETEVTNAEKMEKYMKTAQSFSENILKSLLARIRISLISAKDLLTAVSSEVLCKNYSYLILDVKNFSEICESRKKLGAVTCVSNEDENRVLNNITQIFTVILADSDSTMYKSVEHYSLFPDLTCEICIMFTPWLDAKLSHHSRLLFTAYLKFCSVEDKNWGCTTECQIKMLSHETNIHQTLVLPDANSYTTLTLTRHNPCVKIGVWDWEGNWNDWFLAYRPIDTYTLTLDFKSIHCKFFDKEKKKIELAGGS